MKCPYCEREMEEGYIQGGQGVLFSPNEKVLLKLKNPFSKKDVRIAGLADNASYDVKENAWNLVCALRPLSEKHRFNLKYDLAEYFIAKAAEDGVKAGISGRFFESFSLGKPHFFRLFQKDYSTALKQDTERGLVNIHDDVLNISR